MAFAGIVALILVVCVDATVAPSPHASASAGGSAGASAGLPPWPYLGHDRQRSSRSENKVTGSGIPVLAGSWVTPVVGTSTPPTIDSTGVLYFAANPSTVSVSAIVESDSGGRFVNVSNRMVWEPVTASFQSAWNAPYVVPISAVPVITTLGVIIPCLLSSICVVDKETGGYLSSKAPASIPTLYGPYYTVGLAPTTAPKILVFAPYWWSSLDYRTVFGVTLYAFDFISLFAPQHEVWSYAFPVVWGGYAASDFSLTPVTDSAGLVYMSVDTSLYCLYPNGTLFWRYSPPPAPNGAPPGPILNGPCIDTTHNNYLYVTASQPGQIMAFNINPASRGVHLLNEPVWRQPMQFATGDPFTTPAISPDGKAIYFGAGQTFVALSASGQLLWWKQLELLGLLDPGMIFKDATVSADNKLYVTVGGSLFTVIAFDGATGALLWTFALNQIASGQTSRCILGSNGLIYVSNIWRGVVAIGLGEIPPPPPSAFTLISYNDTSAQFGWFPPVDTDLLSIQSYQLIVVNFNRQSGSTPTPTGTIVCSGAQSIVVTTSPAAGNNVTNTTTVITFNPYTLAASIAGLTPQIEYQVTLTVSNSYGTTPTIATFSFTPPATPVPGESNTWVWGTPQFKWSAIGVGWFVWSCIVGVWSYNCCCRRRPAAGGDWDSDTQPIDDPFLTEGRNSSHSILISGSRSGRRRSDPLVIHWDDTQSGAVAGAGSTPASSATARLIPSGGGGGASGDGSLPARILTGTTLLFADPKQPATPNAIATPLSPGSYPAQGGGPVKPPSGKKSRSNASGSGASHPLLHSQSRSTATPYT